MSAYKGSTGTAMGFAKSCRHRWGPWEAGRTQRWRECKKCDQVDSADLPDGEVHRTTDRPGGPGSRRRLKRARGDKRTGLR